MSRRLAVSSPCCAVWIVALLSAPTSCQAQSFSPPGPVMRDNPASSAPMPLPPTLTLPTQRQNNVHAWGPLFDAQVKRCWARPKGNGEKAIQAVFSIKLKRDGMLDEARLVSLSEHTPRAEAYQASGARALKGCQPYKLPDEYYGEWRHFQPVFTDRLPQTSER